MGDSSITYKKLKNQGYNSVMIPRGGGTEYVVYTYKQVNFNKAEVVEYTKIQYDNIAFRAEMYQPSGYLNW